MRKSIFSATLAAAALLISGIAAAAVAPASIKLIGPSSVAPGSHFTIAVSGRFNVTKAHPYEGGNIAYINQLKGDVSCSHPFVSSLPLSSGIQNHRLRARTPTTPGKFSATIAVTAPNIAGSYTVCGTLVGYPTGEVLKKPRAILHYTVS